MVVSAGVKLGAGAGQCKRVAHKKYAGCCGSKHAEAVGKFIPQEAVAYGDLVKTAKADDSGVLLEECEKTRLILGKTLLNKMRVSATAGLKELKKKMLDTLEQSKQEKAQQDADAEMAALREREMVLMASIPLDDSSSEEEEDDDDEEEGAAAGEGAGAGAGAGQDYGADGNGADVDAAYLNGME
jgi:hypothetical protein